MSSDSADRSTLTCDEKRIIRGFARESFRESSIASYRRALRRGSSPKGDAWMRFMSEVDNPCPDLTLRARYRAIVEAEPVTESAGAK